MLFNIYSRNFSVWRGVLFVVLVVGLMAMGRGAWAFSCDEVTEIPKVQCEALVALYDSTGGDNWTRNDGWKVTNTPCSWYGVTNCGSGNIVYLFLDRNQLTGTIPTELANLVNLTALSLGENQLTGNIPSELGNLTHLGRIYLEENQLTGNIPAELGNLTHLWMLALNGNKLTGTIPVELSNLNLIRLLLGDNELTGTIPAELGNLNNLQSIYLKNNHLCTTNQELIEFLDSKSSNWREGQTNTVCEENQNTPPVALFTASTTSGSSPLQVTVDASDSSDEDGTIENYKWEIQNPNGNITDSLSGLDNATFNLTMIGEYTIILTVTDNDGLTSQISKTITVEKPTPTIPPVASFTASPENGTTPLTVKLDASSSYDEDGEIVKYAWSVNSNPVTPTNNEIVLSEVGTHTITLTVTDNDELTSSQVSKTITVTENKPPVASFTASPESGHLPLTVKLNASNSYDEDGEIVKYAWAVNGNPVTPTNNEIILSEVGTHTITLTVTDDKGATSQASKTITGSKNIPPVPLFTVSPESGPTPLTVSVDASNSYDEDGEIVRYDWSVIYNSMDIAEDSNSNPSVVSKFTLRKVGTHTITLTVTDNEGATSKISKTVVVGPNTPPVASFTASPENGPTPLTVKLNADNSYDEDGEIVKYAWTVDGNSVTLTNNEIILSEVGTHTITLTVTDDKGATSQVSKTITVTENTPPVASFTASPESGPAPLTVNVSASKSHDEDGEIVKYAWTVDGNAVIITDNEIILSEAGTHTLTLIVTDNDGATSQVSKTITVTENIPPVASFIVSPESGPTPLTVSVDASNSYDKDGEIVRYDWSVIYNSMDIAEDSNSDPSVVSKFILRQVGTHTITLTVTDNEGATSETSKTVVVGPKDVYHPPVALLIASPSEGSAPLTVKLDASESYDEDGEIVKYAWAVDGNAVIITDNEIILSEVGEHTITLTVTDDDGATSQASKTITVKSEIENIPPVASFTVLPESGITPLAVKLDASDSYDEDGEIVNYAWTIDYNSMDMAEDSDSNSAFSEIILSKIGIHTITLTVTDNEGAISETSKTVIVNPKDVSPPIALFTASPKSGILPLTVKLDASASYDEDGEIVEYLWEINDNPFSSNDTPIISPVDSVLSEVTFPNSGKYVVNLTVTDNDGATAKTSDTIDIPEPLEKNPDIQIDNSSLLFNSTNNIVDVMVVYTPASNLDGNILNDIEQAIEKANEAYVNSKIKQQLRLVHTAQVNYTESDFRTDLFNLSDTNDGVMDEIHILRNEYGADLVSLWRTAGSSCGIGYIVRLDPIYESLGFNVTARNCLSNHSFAHELGHNMGATHDSYVSNKGEGIYNYSHGYVHAAGSFTNSWRTVMAYQSKCEDDGYGCERINYFSNPDISYNGVNTGTPVENNALTLNNMFPTVSNFRKNKIADNTNSFTIFNKGEADLNISSIVPENNVEWISSISPNSANIVANDSVDVVVTVNYSAISAGENNVNLLINSNDPDEEITKVNITVNQASGADKGLTTDSAKSALFDGNINNLSLDVNIPDVDISYQVNLSLISYSEKPDAFVFKVDNVEELSFKIEQQISNYDAAQGIVEIPAVNVPGEFGNPQLYEVKMELISSNLRSTEMLFEVINYTPIEIIAVH
ncbi:PKD domain-containing protein [Candidatus Halobeggiatoa sp. HSG11]|nr:PKD domain-containing protein [Candidatus Halobeggiatoa sp. HSG11]